MAGREYLLAELPRIVNFPYRLHALGWRPDHLFIHRNTRLMHLFICVTFRKTGESCIIVNGRKRRGSSAPSLSVIRAGTRMETIHASRHDELYFTYDEPAASAVLALGINSGEFRMTPAVEEVLSAIRRNLDVLPLRGVADRLDQLAIRLITECCTASGGEPSEDERIAEISAGFALHFADRIDLGRIAAKYGMSRRSFFRAWKRHFDETPLQYLIARRLAFAEELLAESECDLGEIALRSGFGTPGYLIERFRARHGCSPLEFRRRVRVGGFAGPELSSLE